MRTRPAGRRPMPPLSMPSRYGRQVDQLTPLRRAARTARTRTLSVDTYNTHAKPGDPSSRWFIRHYGSWVAAVEAAGLHAAGRARETWTDAQLIEALTACHAELQAPLTTSRYASWQADHPDRPALSRLKSAGFDRLVSEAEVPRTHGRDRPNRFSDEDLAAAIRRASTNQAVLSADGYNQWRDDQTDRRSLPSAQTIVLRTRSWPAARRHAGIGQPRTDTLTAVREALADIPDLTARSYKVWAQAHTNAPSFDLVIKEHRTWRHALEAATASRQKTAAKR